jgi:hypothetical protein
MRRILIAGMAGLTLGVAVSSAAADPNCTCRARNVVATLGDIVCIATPNGRRLAQCTMVLNNTSWTFLDAPCPQVMLDRLLNPQTAQSSHPQTEPVIVK